MQTIIVNKVDLSKTREQFLKERCSSIWCPVTFGLQSKYNSNNCDKKITCSDCWKDSIKHLVFKGELINE